MIKTKKVLIALAVLAGSMSVANGALAAADDWVGTTGNVWSTKLSDAKLSGMTMTLTDVTKDKNGKGWSNVDRFMAGYSNGVGELKNNKLSIDGATFSYSHDWYDISAAYGTSSGTAVVSDNTLTIKNVRASKEMQMTGGRAGGSANSNIVDIGNSDFGADATVYGALSTNAEACSNAVTISNEVCFGGKTTLVGARGGKNANENSLTVEGVTLSGISDEISMLVAQADTGEACKNTLIMRNSSFSDDTGTVTLRGALARTEDKANENVLKIENTNFGAEESGIAGKITLAGAVSNGEASDNMLTLSNSSFIDATGGISVLAGSGDKKGNGNSLTVNDSSFSNVGTIILMAASASKGEAKKNMLTLTNSSFAGVTDQIVMVAASGDTNVNDNSLTVRNSSFSNVSGAVIFGITEAKTGEASNNTAIYDNVTFTQTGKVTIQGAYGKTKADKTTMTVMNSTFGGATIIYSSDTNDGVASNGVVTVQDSRFSGKADIYGSFAEKLGTATGGKVTVKGTSFAGETNIYGNKTGDDGGTATDGEVTIDGAYFYGDKVNIYGGMGIASASGNKVTINDISFSGIDQCYIFAGASGSDISNNAITINGGDFTGVDSLNILGGSGDNAEMSNNTITINGGKFSPNTSKRFCIYAGDGGATTGTGNVLNINTCVDGIVETIYEPQTINFKAPSGMDTELPMLSLKNSVALKGVDISADVSKISLAADDFITLIDNVNDTDYTPADAHYQVLTLGNSKFLVYSGGADKITTVKPDVVVNAGETPYNSGKSKGVYYDVFNGTDLTGQITGNKMTVDRGTFKNSVYGAGAEESTGTYDIKNNVVNIKGGTFESDNEMNIVAGYGKSSDTAALNVGGDSSESGNQLNISGGKFIRSDSELRLIGGMTNNGGYSGNVRYNILNVRGGFFEAGDEDHSIGLYGAYNSGTVACNATNNMISFGADGGSISVAENSHIKIYGVYDSANSMGVTTSNNTISIIGDTDKTSFVTITGACFSGSNMTVTAKDNVVNIGKDDGSTVFKNIEFKSINAVSGTGTTTIDRSGNILNVNSKIAVTGDVGGFQIINFTLPAGFGESDVMLTVGGTMNFDEGEGNTTIGINALPDGFVAVKGATVTLISANDFKGNYTSGLGTLELKDKKLCLTLLKGPIVAKDLTVDAQVNSGDTLVLIGNDTDNILKKNISGAGGVEIGNGSDVASVKTSAGNLAITGGVTVKEQAGLKITGGHWLKMLPAAVRWRWRRVLPSAQAARLPAAL